VIVMVNGERCELPSSATVASVVELLDVGLGARGVAVALNGEVVTRAQWPQTEVQDGARIEIVAAIGGG
jgi:sulfur carrier protein